MYHLRKILVFTITLLGGLLIYGQQENKCNFNIDNGLPSNHIYTVIKDRLGYLWIATTNGVVRYNGYEFKIFNVANGLNKNDIWKLFEDKKGRMWLIGISDELGYIYKNQFHKAYLKDIHCTIYPREFAEYEDGIIFQSPYLRKDNQSTICIEKNDTIYKVDVLDTILSICHQSHDLTPLRPHLFVFFGQSGQPVFIYDSTILKGAIRNGAVKIEQTIKIRNAQFCGNLRETRREDCALIAGNYFLFYNKKLKYFFDALDLSNGIVTRMAVGDSNKNKCISDIYKVKTFAGEEHLVAKMNNDVVLFDVNDSIQLNRYVNVNEIQDRVYFDKSYFPFSGTWPPIAITNKEGFDLHYDEKNSFIAQPDINLSDCEHVGEIKDSLNFWWDKVNSSLVVIDKDLHRSNFRFAIQGKVYSVTPFAGDTLLVSGLSNYWFKIKEGKLIDIPNILKYAAGAIFVNKESNNKYIVAALQSLCEVDLSQKKDTINVIDVDRYNGMAYDSFSKTYWAYNEGKVFLKGRGFSKIISRDSLSSLGISRIEKIIIDKVYGNIFLTHIAASCL